MELMKAIYERRSIRKYTAEEIPLDALKQILEAGVMAPSGMNLQHWHFVMVRDPEMMEKCQEIMIRVSDIFRPALEKRFTRNPHIVQETGEFLTTLGGAKVMLFAFLSKKEFNDSIPAVSGVCAAIQNMLLAAWDMGIGSCWLTAPVAAKLDHEYEELLAPDKGKFVGCVTFGYPDEMPVAPPRREGKYEII